MRSRRPRGVPRWHSPPANGGRTACVRSDGSACPRNGLLLSGHTMAMPTCRRTGAGKGFAGMQKKSSSRRQVRMSSFRAWVCPTEGMAVILVQPVGPDARDQNGWEDGHHAYTLARFSQQRINPPVTDRSLPVYWPGKLRGRGRISLRQAAGEGARVVDPDAWTESSRSGIPAFSQV